MHMATYKNITIRNIHSYLWERTFMYVTYP